MSAWISVGFHVGHPQVPLRELFNVRWEQATEEQLANGEVSMVDRVSFDGEVFAGAKQETRMEQFIAQPGDIVVSKIRARQGSVGIVQAYQGKVGVSIHYRVLIPGINKVDTAYAWLALRSAYCRAQFLAATGGAMKGEISEEALLEIRLPLPPLATQQAIVERWQEARAAADAAHHEADSTERDAAREFLHGLGLKSPDEVKARKAFAMGWEAMERWGVSSNQRGLQGVRPEDGRYPVVDGYDCIAEIIHGCSASPSPLPTALGVLKISAVTRGYLDISERKYAPDSPKLRKQYDLRKGDVLLCRTNGTLAYVGQSALVEQDQPDLIFPDKVIRVRLKQNILPAYFWLLLHAAPLRGQIEAAARTAVGNYAIGGRDLWQLRLPLPPLETQQALVSAITDARRLAATLRAEAERLRQQAAAEVEAAILGEQAV